MTTAANNEKKNAMTTGKVSVRTIARHIKTMVHGIEQYNVEVSIKDVFSDVTIYPKGGKDEIHCVGDLVRIAEAYKCNYYVSYNRFDNRVEFVIF